ncbi:MAG: SAM-dependent methyltransferase [Treponema sp.]|nr:SAM-dependent methyltransferase [Treponema sp.]
MPVSVRKLGGRAFLAFPEMRNMLLSELVGRFGYGSFSDSATIEGRTFVQRNAVWYGDLLYCPDFDEVVSPELRGQNPYWASAAMLSPFEVSFDSIGEAAKSLKEIQRNWAPYQYQFFRRAALIQDKLPHINLKVRKFPCEIPNTPMGLYTLIGEKKMIASAETTSPLPAGRIQFEEDHENPPSRAYLKIQESLTLAHTFFGVDLPKEGDKCFEAGACPGGWTYVLRLLGADVFAVDRAPLADRLMSDSHVKFLAHDAFTLTPDYIEENFGKLDWLFSDVICYPERLLEWIRMWIDSGKVRNIICTIKMQGEIDWKLIEEFAAIPDSRIVHLNYNKHELTIIIAPPIPNA